MIVMRKFTLATFLMPALMIAGITSSDAQVGVMTTLVGDSIAGYTGDGNLAYLAEISAPHDVCFDAAQNFYFIDQSNYAIRKVSATTGIITTIAGNGTYGNMGDGGLAINATLEMPEYMCIDAAGNIYFTDGESNTIRKINTGGIISTIAGNGTAGYSGDGGLAISAEFNSPKGICLDPAGNLIVADFSNNVIRKINVTTGIVSTIAGSSSQGYTGDGGLATNATMYGPICVCFDAAGNLYVADEINYVIRKVNMTTGIISTFAGNNSYGWAGDGGPALGATIGLIEGMTFDCHGDMYIDDISCSCRKISGTTGVINTVAGSGTVDGYNGDGGSDTSEYLNFPEGLCVDPTTGNIIIADAGNNRIRKATQPGFAPAAVNHVMPVKANIFPNPSNGRFTIVAGTQQTDAAVEIYNAAGELVYSTTLTTIKNDINISNQPPGMYFINIKTAQDVQTVKMTIK